MSDLSLQVGSQALTASWGDKNPRTRDAISDALPLEGDATRWGDELYFSTEVAVPPEETQTEIPIGGIAYWPQGQALCLFWGPTPASHSDEPRAAAPVSVIGQVEDVTPLQNVDGGSSVRIERY